MVCPVNVMARWAQSNVGYWKHMGPVCHRDAAERFCEFFGRGGIVETCYEHNPKITWRHRVSRSITYNAVCLREDDG